MEKIVGNSDCLFDNSDHQSSKRVTFRSLTTILARVIIGQLEQSINQHNFFSTDTSSCWTAGGMIRMNDPHSPK